jgi:hypothetical protein
MAIKSKTGGSPFARVHFSLKRKLLLPLLALTQSLLGASPEHPVILPPDKVTFNRPPPKEMGQKDYFAVAQEGKAACSIILPAKAANMEERSAELLKLYLDLVTGASFEIKREPAGGPGIYIGDTEAGKKLALNLPPVRYASLAIPNLHGFLVQTVDPNTLVIRGLEALGTSFGVVSFLRECVGVRRYWPSEPGGIGDVYERKPTLTIPQLTWRDWPFLISRYVGCNPKAWELQHEKEWPTMFKWYRVGFTLSMMHNFFALVPPAKYGKSHPEYFPELNGVRVVPTVQINWQPCVSNPDVVDLCARQIIRAFDANPNLICHALAVNDGAGDCGCAKCRAMDAPESDPNTAQLTDRYVKFMNAVAEKVAAKHPDKLLGFLCYAGVTHPPMTVKLHKNLVPFYCAMGRGVYPGWDEWMAAGARNMGHYGYHDDRWFTIPKINPHQEARRIRYMAGTDVFRGYYKEFNPTYPLDGQAALVCADMMWDPRLDENKILDRYYSDLFGDAATEMGRFYEILETDYEGWLKRTAPPHPYGPDRSDLDLDHSYQQFEVLSSAGADRAWQALLEAERKAQDGRVKERIRLVKAIFSFVRPCVHEFWTLEALPTIKDPARAETEARKALSLAREKVVIKQKVMEGPVVKPWTMITRQPYDRILPGVIPLEVHMAIDQGFESARLARPDDRGAWQRLAKDGDPVIAQSAQAVLTDLKNQPNLAEDPGFESSQLPTLFHALFKKGSVQLSTDHPHSGKQCAVLFDCKQSSIIRKVEASPGEKFRISVWLRANDHKGGRAIPGLYGVQANLKRGAKMVDSIRIAAHPGDQWQEVAFPITTPAGTETLEVLVTAQRQHAKARLYVDDLSIIRVPVAPLKTTSAPAQTAPPDAPPEE